MITLEGEKGKGGGGGGKWKAFQNRLLINTGKIKVQ